MAVFYGPVLRYDPDASDYFARISAAGSTITDSNKLAVDAFVRGCKADGIWSAIKASCLLAGPDDLTGALVPLVGAAPTNNNFVSGDYNRATGLKGDGSSKALKSNYDHAAAGQNDRHMAAYISVANSNITSRFIDDGRGTVTGGSHLRFTGSQYTIRVASSSLVSVNGSSPTGLFAASRANSTEIIRRYNGNTLTIANQSAFPVTAKYVVFARGFGDNPFNEYSDARLSFYSIGESLDLALLDARLATYMSSLT